MRDVGRPSVDTAAVSVVVLDIAREVHAAEDSIKHRAIELIEEGRPEDAAHALRLWLTEPAVEVAESIGAASR